MSESLPLFHALQTTNVTFVPCKPSLVADKQMTHSLTISTCFIANSIMHLGWAHNILRPFPYSMNFNILNKSHGDKCMNKYQHTPDKSTFHITMQTIIITEREREREREREKEREREIAIESGELQTYHMTMLVLNLFVDLRYCQTALNKIYRLPLRSLDHQIKVSLNSAIGGF